MARPIIQAWAVVVLFVLLGIATITLTNNILDSLASSKPSVTFSIVSTTPPAPTTP